MSGINETRVQDTRNDQNKSAKSCKNWELITVTAVLALFLALFVVYCSKEQCICKCSSDLDVVLKLTEKISNLEKTVEDLKGRELEYKPGQKNYAYVPGPNINIVQDHCRVSQSSEWSSPQYPAKLAIDGDPKTFAHTGIENKPWWTLEFCYNIIVAKVTMRNRLDCCDDQMTNIVITVDDNICGEVIGPIGIGNSISVKCPQPLVGKVVKVEKQNLNTLLSFSEIQIFSSSYDC